jgi:hypothetical protein
VIFEICREVDESQQRVLVLALELELRGGEGTHAWGYKFELLDRFHSFRCTCGLAGLIGAANQLALLPAYPSPRADTSTFTAVLI